MPKMFPYFFPGRVDARPAKLGRMFCGRSAGVLSLELAAQAVLEVKDKINLQS